MPALVNGAAFLIKHDLVGWICRLEKETFFFFFLITVCSLLYSNFKVLNITKNGRKEEEDTGAFFLFQ